ncbi:efflux RND transporter permease subunit [Solidesulfovibrio carbinolicus]|uniref:Multidrug transporter AcrB n=1 Tax=Solidesulfovibrio carbinolicus TaxID=296842 RepID=A0A4P6HP07_9BACT|nr:efflux RND transporter permease subunit [Solidesulfovibrio carbinolicus]QAZ68815.1 multidrug transporter AcrB [Solidesulfovibrio carbinolicus]
MKGLNLSEWAVTHRPLTLFLIILVSLAGTWSYFHLGRAEDPDFTVKQMIISAAWPGATADEMQRLVADPIEKKLQEVPYFDKVNTYSRAGSVVMKLAILESTPKNEVRECWYQARKRVGDIKSNLPSGVLGPFFNDEFGDVDSVLYVLTGPDFTIRQLEDEAETIRQALLRVPSVTKVRFYGEQTECIFVELNNAKLATLGIAPQAVFDSIAKQNDVTPAGTLETAADAVHIRVDGALKGVEALAEVPVASGGKVFRLGDIASFHRGPQDPPTFVARHEGQPAIAMGVVMAQGGNILDLGRELDAAMERIRADLPLGFEISRIADQPQVVEESVNEFIRSFVEALVIVLAVSFLSLGWRTGIVVALAVPLVLAMVMTVMSALGMSLERISLGALIIALGLLVDDAIISVEMMVVKMEQGYDRVKAATYAWTATAFPMLTGTLVTAAGFLPVGFAKSSSGEYAGGIFWVVAIALVASWLVAVIFTPYLGLKLLPDFHHGAHDDPNAIYRTPIYLWLRGLVTWCVDHRKTVVWSTALLFLASLVGFSFVSRQFFPSSSRPELLVEVRLPAGSAFGTTAKAVEALEAVCKADQEVKTYTSYIGAGAPRWFMPMSPELPDVSYGVIVLNTADGASRDRVKARLEAYAANGGLPEARVRVTTLFLGPPVGYPVQFRVIGPDAKRVRDIAYQVRDVMRANPNTTDVNLDWNEQARAIRLVVDQDRARLLGLTPQDIAQALQTLLSGVTITQVRDGIERVNVVARAVPEERLRPEILADLTISIRDGKIIPLSQAARLEHVYEEPILWRQSRDLTITVRSEVLAGLQAPDVTMQIAPKLKSIEDTLPPGYRIEAGGAFEESSKANQSIVELLPLAGGVMLLLLMFQVQSFPSLFLVLTTAPLGLIGAAGALLLFGQPFGFVAMLGVLALAGMIMRNTVILVDQIGKDIEEGMAAGEAVIDATIRRTRPVALTALAAILAMIPLARNIFWGPMAVAIMGGLFVATVLTLLFTPALYAMVFRIDKSGRQ